jgi:hypothetical protein
VYNTGSKDILTGHTLIIFPLSFLELSASFVELQLTWLGATCTTYLLPTGKASPTVDGDAAREPHSTGDAMSGTGKGEGETWGLCTKEMRVGRPTFQKQKTGPVGRKASITLRSAMDLHFTQERVLAEKDKVPWK